MAYYDVLTSPLGDIFVAGSAAGLHRIEFVRGAREEAAAVERLAREVREPVMHAPGLAGPALDALAAYFEGASFHFGLPLAPHGSEFQLAVWEALLDVPAGETASYGQIARAVGRPAASRAVGRAIGSNPLAIVVPCHRVIGASGALTGYASGLDRKRWLLAHEATAVTPDRVRA